MKLKEYEVNMVECGENIHTIVVCKSQKRAAELLRTDVSYIRNYGYCNEPRTQVAIDNPETVYAYCNSGTIFRERKDLLRVVMPKTELINIIRNIKSYD
jgi:hypothetical protein